MQADRLGLSGRKVAQQRFDPGSLLKRLPILGRISPVRIDRFETGCACLRRKRSLQPFTVIRKR